MIIFLSVTGIATGFLLGAVWSLVSRVQPLRTQLLDLMQSLEIGQSLETDGHPYATIREPLMSIVTRERDIPVVPDGVVYEPAPDLSTNYTIPIPPDDFNPDPFHRTRRPL